MPRPPESPRAARTAAGVVALVVVVAVIGLLARLWVMSSPSGVLNSDEAYTGLQAMEIVQGRYAAVIEGTSYTAVLDSYVFAPIVFVVGAHAVLLKLLPVAFWAVASLLAAGVANAVRGRRAALVAGSLMWLAPGTMMIISTRAYPGYAIGMAFVVGACWSATKVVGPGEPVWWRSLLTGALGGLALYAHPMYLAVVVPLLAVVSVYQWRAVLRWWLPALAGGLLVNLPFLLWNSWNDWPSLNADIPANDSYTDRLLRFANGLVPRMFGARSQDPTTWIYPQVLGIVVSVAVIAVAAYGGVLLARRGRKGLLVAVPLASVFLLMALLSPLSYVLDGRYGVVPLPFLVIAIATAVDHVAGRTTVRSVVTVGVTLALWVGVICLPFLRRELGTDLLDPNANVQAVIDRVRAEGFDRVAGSFWLMMPTEYLSDRELRTATIGVPSTVRVPASQAVVASTPPERIAIVFPTWDEQPASLPLPIDQYERIVVGDAVIYLPIAGRS